MTTRATDSDGPDTGTGTGTGPLPGVRDSSTETTLTLPAVTTTETRPTRSGLSVRTRLTLTVAMLTTFAMLTAGIVIYTVESARRDVAVVNGANEELAELRRFVESGTDPATGAPFTDADPLLRAFLARNVAGPHEMLAAWLGDRVRLRSRSPHPRVIDEAPFRETVQALLSDGGSRRTQTSAGEVLLTVQPVRGGDADAALVVVSFLVDERESLNELLRTYLLVSLLAMLLITGLAAWQGSRLLSPLRALSDAAREISGSDLSRRVPETGNDDITDLTRTVNDMLERLETAFVGQRQFLDDAGHELRTPLTILQGHLELLDVSDAREVESTRVLLLDEVERMSRLVDDLIVLAKVRRPDFLSPGPVDLDELTATVLAKARPMADRTWVADPMTAVRVVVDEQRITQAVLQLVDNAIKHTDVGDVIAIGSSTDQRTARVWVRDSGDGIQVSDRAALLERFARGSVRPDDEGFGLGLSIVNAIATAHGGQVIIEDTPGGGATVAVEFQLEEASWPAS